MGGGGRLNSRAKHESRSGKRREGEGLVWGDVMVSCVVWRASSVGTRGVAVALHRQHVSRATQRALYFIQRRRGPKDRRHRPTQGVSDLGIR